MPDLLFLQIRLLDILDILLVAYLFYLLYHLIKGTVAIRIFVGIAGIYLVWKLVEAFQMEMLGEILGQFIGVGVIALIIVFQQELRKFLLMLGSTGWNRLVESPLLKRFFTQRSNDEQHDVVKTLSRACLSLSGSKTGALLVLGRNADPMLHVQNGDEINANLSSDLIKALFHKESPMHDGAMIIHQNKIVAVRGVLPVSDSQNIPKDLGMRHRSALGISELSDVMAIAISEENGGISIAEDGKLKVDVSVKTLERELNKTFSNS